MSDHETDPDFQPERAEASERETSDEETQGRREFLGKGAAVAAGATIAAASLSPLLAEDAAQEAPCRTFDISFKFDVRGGRVDPQEIMRALQSQTGRVEGLLREAVECEPPCWHLHIPNPYSETIPGVRVDVGSMGSA